jgi:tetratricopeptide (TPR) repeat protein
LPAEEQAVFEQQLRADPQLAEAVALHRDMITGFKRAIRRDVDRERKDHYARLEQQAARRPRAVVPLWLTGIAASLVLGVGVYLLSADKHDKLFDAYYQPYMAGATERGGTATEGKAQALQAYEEGDYERAAALLGACLRATPPDAECLFYAGLAALGRRRLPEAERYLLQVVSLPPNDYAGRARWYLALAYLKDDQPQKAEPLLRELRGRGGFYGKKAGELLAEL